MWMVPVVVVAWGAMYSARAAEPRRPTLHQLELVSPEPDGRRAVSVNPPTFRWPVFAEPPYVVEIGQREDLSDGRRFPPVRETFLRPFKPLEPGRYYWRAVGKNGKTTPTVSFAIGKDVARWAIPPWDEALAKVPRGRPRLLLRPEDLPRWRELGAGECKAMVTKWAKWARGVIGRELPTRPKSIDDVQGKRQRSTMRRVYARKCAYDLAGPIQTLCILYLVTEDPRYAKEIRRRALAAAKLDPRGEVTHRVSDFANGMLALNMGRAHDTLYDEWSAEERERLRNAILERCRIGFRAYKPRKEQSLPGAHAWQHVIQDLTMGALAIYDESAEARDWFAWSFKMHVALYPWFGGADGGSAEGTAYYAGTNMLQSIKAAAMFEAATGVSLFESPWYRNTPYFLLYTHGLGNAKSQFADGSGLRAVGNREKLATTLWAARLDDPYVVAYERAIAGSTSGDATDCLRLAWSAFDRPAPRPLTELPKARAFREVGVVAMRSDLMHPENDIYFELRSSPYGSYNHAHADQNAFNVVAFGERLIADTGYYHSYGDDHHYGWTVRSRAHNTILIGGEEQAYRNIDAYGEIVDFEIGDGFVRTVGLGPNAYHDVKVDRFDRHVLWLEPDVWLIADDLEIRGAQRFQWLLHSMEKMAIDGNTVELAVGDAVGRLQFFEPAELTFKQTDQFSPPPAGWRPDKKKHAEFPNQWHLMASTIEPASQQRFVSVLQVWRKGERDGLPAVEIERDAEGVTLHVSDGRRGRVVWRDEWNRGGGGD